MPNAPSDPAETARVLVETAHRVLDQAHPGRETTVRVVPLAIARRENAQRATENVVLTVIAPTAMAESVARTGNGPSVTAENAVRTVTDLKEIVLIAATVRPVTVSVVRMEIARNEVIVPLAMETSVSGSHARVTSVVSGNPARAAIASLMVTASPTVTALSARVLLVEIAPVTLLVMAAVMVSGVSGNPVRVATASRLATAPTVSAPVVTRGSVAHTAIARSVMAVTVVRMVIVRVAMMGLANNTGTVRARMTAVSARSAQN